MELEGTFSILKHDLATIHSYQSPDPGLRVCSHIVETADKLVIVDALLLRPYAKQLRRYADGLGKPIERVIISHGHADHWLGLEFFQDVPIYALAEIKGELEYMGDWYLKFRQQVYGNLVPETKTVPNQVLAEGSERIGGLEFVFRKVTGAESPVALCIELPELKTLIAQDLVYNQVYLFIGETSFDAWIAELQALQGKGFETVLPGHGEPADSKVFANVIEYLQTVKQIRATAKDENDLKQRTLDCYPYYRVPELVDTSNFFIYHRNW